MRKLLHALLGVAFLVAPVVVRADDHYKGKTHVKIEKDGDAKIKTTTRDATGKHRDVADVQNIDYLAFPRGNGIDEDYYMDTSKQDTFTHLGGGGYSAYVVHGKRALKK